MIFKTIPQHPLPGLLPGAVLTVLATLITQLYSALAFSAGQGRKHSYLLISNRISLPYTIF
jgi:hypothetical protein